MKAEVRIPSPYNAESLILSMQTLKLDPNFAALCAMMKENDIKSMETDLIDGIDHLTGTKLDETATAELRYRRGVFNELLSMPDTIIQSMQTERKAKAHEEERADPYSTEADIEKERGG